MADSYAGVTISPIMGGEWRPHWERESNVAITHIPYSNTDDVQFAGKGNQQIGVDVLLNSATADVDIETLISAAGDGTARSLVLWSETYTSVYLLKISSIQRVEDVERWRATLLFMKPETVGS